ncbi:uncharacterized protein CANTADRAFT_24082 [Suhomyces tanzawaensis NRRL Y-17324]|uniref:Uncharacterized protein n=1 Tax=Suhomyces tanzawaensis NRRL Y-17324 TaxID=984487 RepID=A0A1E4SBF9_9ASCO|nr:uncharacterized protein CANTADRAFT_24082 [Suhomyces tanzawaensis NRRL Y-17324]ODV76815.1 hypothetical protein CANTADRAFT_24082 [Suhomyces tanzawaensis NRRL Y-17324]
MSTSKLYPTYYGYVGSTKDALLIIQEIVDKQLELVPRRPHERERPSLIKSGNVFVFIEEHSGIKRWTDGIAWSPSRILGRFLVYRELDKHSLSEKDDKKKKRRKISVDQDPLDTSTSSSTGAKQRGPSIPHAQQLLPQNEGALDYNNSNNNSNKNSLGALVTSYVFKDQGLIKKTLSLTTTTKELHIEKRVAKQTIHLISYYNADDVLNGKLQRPSKTDLKDLTISNALWNSVKDSSLGGKIPMEDEAYYFLDTNYQLQNMSLLQQAPQAPNQALVAKHRGQSQSQPQHPGQHQQQLQHQQLQHQMLSPQQMQYMQKFGVQSQQGAENIPPGFSRHNSRHNSHPPTHTTSAQQYLSPVTQQQQTQQVLQYQTGAHQGLPVDYSQYPSNNSGNIKREDEQTNNAVVANELTFINPFTGAPHQSNFSYGQNSVALGGSGNVPGAGSGPASTASGAVPMLNMAAPQQYHPGYAQIAQPQHEANLVNASNSANSFFPPFPQHYQQQLYANQQQHQAPHHSQASQQSQSHQQGHLTQQQAPQQLQQSYQLGSISGSSDQFSISGGVSNGSVSSINSNIPPAGSNSNSFSGVVSGAPTKKNYRSGSGGTSTNSISSTTGNSGSGGWFTTNPPIGSSAPYISSAPPPLAGNEGGEVSGSVSGPSSHLYHPINSTATSGGVNAHSNLGGTPHHFYMHPSHPLANNTTGMSGSSNTLAGGSEETSVPTPAVSGSATTNTGSYGYQNSN